jgi:hypothetical protein
MAKNNNNMVYLKPKELLQLIKKKEVAVWVQLGEDCGGYMKVTKFTFSAHLEAMILGRFQDNKIPVAIGSHTVFVN